MGRQETDALPPEALNQYQAHDCGSNDDNNDSAPSCDDCDDKTHCCGCDCSGYKK